MSMDVYKVLKEMDSGDLIDVISPSMDDYLFIMDLQKNTLRTSQSAAERFMLPDKCMDDAANSIQNVVYEKDWELLSRHLRKMFEGTEKKHNLLYRLLNKKGMPVWINCRGEVIDDEKGRPCYLIGCLNETGKRQRADNISGLLGEGEMGAYLYSHAQKASSGFLMQVGIDDFCTLNNAQGVIYGNYILKSVADCITECLSERQRLYYLVADKYMIIDLQSKTKDAAIQLRNRICEKIDDFIVTEKYKAIFSVSVGITDISTLWEGAEECRKKSDFSLQQAKSSGKSSIYFFDQEDYKFFLRKDTILSALRSATANQFEGFEVYYQPIIDCYSGNVVGAEALMRFSMQSENGEEEQISPMEFIPLLEASGLIIPAGQFVLDEAAKMCREMQEHIPDFNVNVNVSYIQIMRGRMANKIISAIEANHLQPESICIEMTESGFMDMIPCFCKFRKKLEENNIQFVIDDFGSGYSNLHCITDMNPDYVKIDKDFTAKAMCNEKDYELFKKIIEMVHSINVKICIEGIEKEVWDFRMKGMHVDYLQGYLFGRPCGKKEFYEQFVNSDGK